MEEVGREKGEKKRFDLEDRTLRFARGVLRLVNNVPRSLANVEVCKQLIRSAGSVGANYIEANEALSKRDFVFRLRIARKEAKEARYWLHLLHNGDNRQDDNAALVQEATELLRILSAIIEKSK